MEKEIKALLEHSLGQFKNRAEHFLFGLSEIEKHIPELRDLFSKKDPHLLDEIADVYIWAKMIMLTNNVGDDIVLKRINRFKEKIKQAMEKKRE